MRDLEVYRSTMRKLARRAAGRLPHGSLAFQIQAEADGKQARVLRLPVDVSQASAGVRISDNKPYYMADQSPLDSENHPLN